MPGLIEELETRQGELEEITAAGGFYQREHTEVQKTLDELTEVQMKLEQAFDRWSELEG